MKKRVVLSIILLISLLFIGVCKIEAQSNIDLSKIEYNFVQENNDNHQSHGNLKIDGIEYSDKYDYCITFTDNNSKPVILNDTISSDEWSCSENKIFTLTESMLKIYESKSEIYLWLASSNDNNTWDISDSKKINRLNFLDLGERIVVNYFSSDDVISSFDFRDEVYTKSNLNYKIGVISDSEIINDITNSSLKFSDVLNFAKNDTKGKTGTASFSNPSQIYNSISNYDTSKYYYVYFYFDDYDLEDVNYYTYDSASKILTAGKITHYNGTTNDTNISTSNPATNDINFSLILLMLILLVITLLLLFNKLKKVSK